MAKLNRGLYNVTPEMRGGIVTIGNFDGVHLGHKVLINQVCNNAKESKVPSVVVTFEPQPMEFFKGEEGVARLTRLREKFSALNETPIDYVLVLRFDEEMANLTAQEFIKKILVDQLAVRSIIVGDDFRFGMHRQGDFVYLQTEGKKFGFEALTLPSQMLDDERISSTRIREVLANNHHALAERLLGRSYTMMGRVVHGNKLGRELGYPTANIYLHRKVTPLAGIYIVRMHGLGKIPLPGVANLGLRPTIGGTRILLEVHLFDFDQDLYGRHVSVEFCEKIRAEERYENLELLKEAIAKDAIKAREYFRKRGEL